jgi:hypothetical protein
MGAGRTANGARVCRTVRVRKRHGWSACAGRDALVGWSACADHDALLDDGLVAALAAISSPGNLKGSGAFFGVGMVDVALPSPARQAAAGRIGWCAGGWWRAGWGAAAFLSGWLMISAGMMAVLVAAARAAEPFGMVVLRHD